MGEVAVLGVGQSLSLFNGDMFAIGVNDIWAKYATDIVLCVDPPDRFNDQRRAVIKNCKPLAFYSQLEAWNFKKGFKKITLQIGYPEYICNLDLPDLPKSLCSPFVACALAYKLGFTTIHLYGVDLIDHPVLTDLSVKKIIKHFGTLKTALKEKSVDLIVHGNGVLQKKQ